MCGCCQVKFNGVVLLWLQTRQVRKIFSLRLFPFMLTGLTLKYQLVGLCFLKPVVCYPARCLSQAASQPEPSAEDNEAVNPTFINRNPRNLEQMALAVKDRGWKTTWPHREFYHRSVWRKYDKHVKIFRHLLCKIRFYNNFPLGVTSDF